MLGWRTREDIPVTDREPGRGATHRLALLHRASPQRETPGLMLPLCLLFHTVWIWFSLPDEYIIYIYFFFQDNTHYTDIHIVYRNWCSVQFLLYTYIWAQMGKRNPYLCRLWGCNGKKNDRKRGGMEQEYSKKYQCILMVKCHPVPHLAKFAYHL